MQFRKLAAVAGSALVAGMTIASPALAAVTNVPDWLNLASGSKFPLFVMGQTAKTSDVAGALDLAVRMAGQSTTAASGGTTTIETVTNGAKVETSGTKLVPYASLQSVKPILTSNDLSLLADGTFTTASGAASTFKQYIYMGGETTAAVPNTPYIAYSTPTSENSPRLSLKLPSGNTVYTYKLTFSTPVSMSSATTATTLDAILKGTSISIMGSDFVITGDTYGSGATPITDITVVGGNNIVQVNTGDSKSVTDTSGTTYSVALTSVGTEVVGGTTYYDAIGTLTTGSGTPVDFSIRSGTTQDIGGVKVAAVKVYSVGTSGGGAARIVIGANEIKLPASGSVTKANTVVTGLTSAFTQSAASWNGFTISYAPNSDAFLKVGDSMVDAFAGAFSMKFQSFAPDITDTVNRQTLSFTPSGYNMLFGYKNADNNAESIYTAYVSSASTTSGASTFRWGKGASSASNTDNSFQDLVFDESSLISAIDGDYFVINYGGFSHVMQFTSADFANSLMTFTDEKANSINVYNTSATAGSLIVDGNSYTITIVNGNSNGKKIRVDLDKSGTTNTVPGAGYSHLVPSMISSGQGGVYFYGNTTNTIGIIKANQTLSPTAGAATYAAIGLVPIEVIPNVTSAGAASTTATQVRIGGSNNSITNFATNYITGSSATGYLDFVVISQGDGTYNVGLGTSGTGLLTKPGLVLVEEAQQGGTTHSWVYVPFNYDSTNVRTYMDTPQSDDTNYAAASVIGGSTGQAMGMTTYGTLVSYVGSSAGGTGTLSYPDIFSSAGVYLLGPGGAISSGTVGGGVSVVPVTTDVVKLDSEVTDADKTANDLVLVGGPCVNSLVASLATAGKFAYTCDNWPGENFGIAKVIQDGFATGKVAFVVAGTRAEDTDNLARMLQTGSITLAAPAVKVVTATQQVSMAA